MTKRLFIKTYGCQMNVYDSARMGDLLAPLGYQISDELAEADMVILNTCHIREKAAEKVYSELGRLRQLKAERAARGEDLMIAVGGCVAQAEGAEIKRRAPCVDIVFGPQTYHRLPEMVARAARSGLGAAEATSPRLVIDTEFPAETKFDFLPESAAPQGVAAFLSIQEGCDKFCTYCVVPYTRGPEYSRPGEEVLAEARQLVSGGAREITLLGQNVNAYHGRAAGDGEWGLGRLIRELAGIDGLARIRYTTSHPGDVDDALIAAHRDVPQLMPFLHLPVQSGADRILEAMNRRHDSDSFRRTVARFRAARPDIAFSSDFIVGFPGETEAEFGATLDLVRDIGFAQAFSFKYSPRPGTPAAALPDAVPEPVKTERLARLQELLTTQQREFNRGTIGKTLPVLFEKPGRRPGQLVGKTPYLQAVHVTAPAELIGTVEPVRMAGLAQFSLAGDLETLLPDAKALAREAPL